MKKINIAFIVGSLACGGAERQVVELVNSLDPNIFNRYLFVLWNNENGFKNILDKKVLYNSIQFRKKYFLYGMSKLLFFLYRNKIDIIHSHMYHPNIIASIVSMFKPKCVFMTGEHGKNEWKRWHHHLFERTIISKRAKMRTAASNDIRNLRIKLDGADPQKILFMPNGTRVQQYSTDTTKTPQILGSLGRLVPLKDFITLIAAFKIVRNSGAQLELKIAGRGEDRTRIQNYIDSEHLGKFVHLVGHQNSDDFLRSIDLFAMSSLQEGIPLALLEAMACGLPCVATSVGGIPDVISHEENGLLVPSQVPSLLAKSISRYLADPIIRSDMGHNAKKTIIDRFSIEHVADVYTELYSNLQISG